MRFRIEEATLGDFFIKKARVSDYDGKSLYTEYCNAKQAAELRHPQYGNIAPVPIKYTGDEIRFKNLSGYETVVPSLFHEDNSVHTGAIELVEKLGSILALIHDCDSCHPAQAEFPGSFPLTVDKYLNLNPAVLDLLKHISKQSHAAINQLREDISSDLTHQCHIHGDFKPDNILLRGCEIQITDWELSGQGVPEHDFASFYAGIFTELVHRSIYQSTGNEKGTARKQLSSATNSSILCTSSMIGSYNKVKNCLPDFNLLTRLIGAKLLARAAMHSYINAGRSPLTAILQQAAEHCLNNPSQLSHLLAPDNNGRTANALL